MGSTAKDREELLNTFVKYVPAAVAMLDRDMRYLQVSDRWCADYLLSSSQMLGRSHYEIFPDLPERWKEKHRRGLAGETLRSEEDRWDREDGTTIWLRWEIQPWGNLNGLPQGILIFTEDATRHKQIEGQLRESEETTRALLETAGQAIMAVDAKGAIILANLMTAEMFGYAPGELLGQNHELLVPPRLRDRHTTHRAGFVENPKTRPMGIGLDLWGARKDGSEFPIEVSLSSVNTRQGQISVAFVSDITVRNKAETDLRKSEQELRALARQLLTAQEDERRRIARDLHDEVTQRLAFLAIEIGTAANEIGGSAETLKRCHDLQSQVFQILEDVRRISHGLHPSVIEDFGLGPALEELCQEFGAYRGIQVEFDRCNQELPLDPGTATCLYRVAQEALNNAAKHGNATQVRVTLAVTGGKVRLLVRDNGSGFRARQELRKGLGLASMKERIRMVGGTISVASQAGRGVEVAASIPLAGGL